MYQAQRFRILIIKTEDTKQVRKERNMVDDNTTNNYIEPVNVANGFVSSIL